ncbi:hypothetical protein [Pediococcus claussenii]|uniref:hypothetical protein n=1 Tax=Pediococcus claussenii TaxID=187452 RepID=UPI00081AB0AA|nr:hypothetical protein [Pediococcus claussenii]ANZ70341.1 hypothetical protein AYR57_08445 [Pediococcus claussenii]ANZ72157.1 hypothetical protein AYR58_08445 [Pediococcus claussenii]
MTEEQLQQLIEEVGVTNIEQAIKKHRSQLTYMNVFRGIKIESEDIERINRKYHVVTNPYVEFNKYRSPYSRKGHMEPYIGFDVQESGFTHDSIGECDPHVAIKTLVFSLLGKKNGKELEEDELKFARTTYIKFKQMYLDFYELRLKELEQ